MISKSVHKNILLDSHSILILVILSVFLFVCSHLSQFFGNLGWVALIQALTEISRNTEKAWQSEQYFAMATQLRPLDQNLWLGYGTATAIGRDENLAQQRWLTADVDASVLHRFAQALDAQGKEDLALLLLRSSLSVPNARERQVWMQSATRCQLSYGTITTLMKGNQQYCHNLFEKNDNLVINGSFEHGDILGWSGSFFFSTPEDGELRIDQTTGKPAPSLLLNGYQTNKRYGVYQKIALQPGTIVHFSGYFKLTGELPLEARILYIEWREENRINGNQETIIRQSIDWTYIERTFEIPERADSLVQFYPILLEGSGIAHIDDIRISVGR